MFIEGFSKLSKLEKIQFLSSNTSGAHSPERFVELLKSFWHPNQESQKIFDEFSENTITNFFFPYGVVPNFLLNGKIHNVPMVIEESSVVAACSKAAKFWQTRGGFKAEIIGTDKVGQIHFHWEGQSNLLRQLFETKTSELKEFIAPLEKNMVARGGGLKSLSLVDKSELESGLFQIFATFKTCDAMGANFINTILEALAQKWKDIVANASELPESERKLTVIMSILSNFTPNCRVRASVECAIEDLAGSDLGMSTEEFIWKFNKAVRIAELDIYRATTHNKGIFNGIDAVVLATGNDFRAVEACAHAFASTAYNNNGNQYQSLSHCSVENGKFKFWLEVPMAVGTIGGLTALHPMAKVSLDMLGGPTAEQLMMIAASIGLAQNFAAIRSLVTTGIQKGHMKMHLMNILNHMEASEEERNQAKKYFEDKVVSFSAVREFLSLQRKYH